MNQEDKDQNAKLMAKAARSPEEQAVVDAFEKAEDASEALEEAQEALQATPSTTV